MTRFQFSLAKNLDTAKDYQEGSLVQKDYTSGQAPCSEYCEVYTGPLRAGERESAEARVLWRLRTS